MDQEFSKRRLSQGVWEQSPPEAEAKCVQVYF